MERIFREEFDYQIVRPNGLTQKNARALLCGHAGVGIWEFCSFFHEISIFTPVIGLKFSGTIIYTQVMLLNAWVTSPEVNFHNFLTDSRSYLAFAHFKHILWILNLSFVLNIIVLNASASHPHLCRAEVATVDERPSEPRLIYGESAGPNEKSWNILCQKIWQGQGTYFGPIMYVHGPCMYTI